MDIVSERFSMEVMVRSYHVYKDVWKAAVGEELRCGRCSSTCERCFL